MHDLQRGQHLQLQDCSHDGCVLCACFLALVYYYRTEAKKNHPGSEEGRENLVRPLDEEVPPENAVLHMNAFKIRAADVQNQDHCRDHADRNGDTSRIHAALPKIIHVFLKRLQRNELFTEHPYAGLHEGHKLHIHVDDTDVYADSFGVFAFRRIRVALQLQRREVKQI